jgi:SAM-dependent methyltransferase
MAEPQIRFDDGAAYERMMGVWSRLAGEIFLDWLAPRSGLRWIDVGCGNGAFTELIVERHAPAEVQGIDPSDGQLTYARTRPATRIAQFRQGDAMELPFPSHRFDVAVMALVIFSFQTLARASPSWFGWFQKAERWPPMRGTCRVVDFLCSRSGLRCSRWVFPPLSPPSAHISSAEALKSLWIDAGLLGVETRRIDVQRTFSDFDDFWTTAMLAPSTGPTVASMPPDDVELLKKRVGARLPADSAGRITCGAWANAVKGSVPN